MARQDNLVYQFMIMLHRVQPAVWRRIHVPKSYSFWDLHVAIQDAMGWLDYHLHEFTIVNPETRLQETIGIPDDDFEMSPTRASWETKIDRYFTDRNTTAEYKYDFGDGWQHSITFEDVFPRSKGTRYPICTDGRSSCPPEDCGGAWGYEDFLRKIRDPDHPEHMEMLQWVGGSFDPDRFDPGSVEFDDPAARWVVAFATPEDDGENAGRPN